MPVYHFDAARTFLYTHARLLERRLFEHLYEGAPAEPVLRALRAYQNADGGFGNALEADSRTPASQPLALEQALSILDTLGCLNDEMTLRACDWLETVSTPQGGVPFSLLSVEGYPHQPWMGPGDGAAQLNPTASLCALLLKGGVQHAWVQRASAFCWQAIPSFNSDAFHDLMPVIHFLIHTPDRRDQAAAELARLRAIVARPGVVTLDPTTEGYVKFPLDWAPRPDSFLRTLFSDADLRTHIQALAERQQPDGGWPLNWVALSPAAEAEWRGVVTLENMLRLDAYAKALA